MNLRKALGRVAPASRRLRRLLLILGLSLLLSPLSAKTVPVKTAPAVLDSGYVPALAAADHFLQAWQSGDKENGIALLTSRAKVVVTTDGIDRFFSNSATSAYEIGRGKLLKRGRYEFPVVLVSIASGNRTRRRFSSIVIVNTGNNDWAVDKLP
jgi:hypothetical protein